MTDRVRGCWVAFEKDIRDDDVQPLLATIRQLPGVSDVTAEITMSKKFFGVLHPELLGKLPG